MLLPMRPHRDVAEIIRLSILGLVYAYALAVAAAEIVLATLFSNVITECASLPPLTVSSWLVCDGVVSLCLVFLLLVKLSQKIASLDSGASSATSLSLNLEISASNQQTSFCFISAFIRKLVSDLLVLFKVSWIVVGAVILWRDCRDYELKPISVKSIFFQALVSSFVCLGLLCFREIYKQNE